jgi:hypothetical protein
MATRVRHVMGPLATDRQLAGKADLYASLLSDRWIAINDFGKPVKGTSLTFTPLANRYRFSLELPDADDPSISVFWVGETSPHTMEGETAVRGQILYPPECSGSRISIDGFEEDDDVGTILPVRFLDACRFFPFHALGPTDDLWEFQSESSLIDRLKAR